MDKQNQFKTSLVKVIGVLFVFCLLIIWCFNLKNLWLVNDYSQPAAGTDKSQDWTSLRDNLSNTLNGLSDQLKSLEKNRKLANEETNNQLAGKKFLASLLEETAKFNSSTAANIIPTTSPDFKNSSTSSVSSTSSPASKQPAGRPATSSPQYQKTDCPKYIDCLPTIGVARPCKVPVGCEKITVIAY